MRKIIFELQRFADTIYGTIIDDKISNTLNSVVIYALGRHDSVYNSGSYVTIDGGDGNDTISNSGSTVSVEGGAGDDSIFNSGYYVTINGDNGDDTITNSYSSSNAVINGGAGNDKISDHYGRYSTVYGGSGNDIIDSGGEYSTLYGGDGDDLILVNRSSYGYVNLIDAGKGNDTVSLGSGRSNNLITYAQGDGNDTIYGYNANDTIHITSGNFSTLKSGNDFIISVESGGSIVLKDALAEENAKVRIKNTSGDIIFYGADSDPWSILSGTDDSDTLSNTLNGVAAIYGYSGNDSIYNSVSYVTIDGGAGSDTIYNSYGHYSSISGGSGNDSIGNIEADSVTIDAGDGNDTVRNTGNKVLIYGGAGNDSIHNGTVTGKGKDVTIYAGEGNDTLYMNYLSSRSYSYGGEGNDAILLYYCRDVVVNGGAGDDRIFGIEYDSHYITISGGTGNDVISLSKIKNSLIKYASGDGVDTISGFSSSDSLQIIGATTCETIVVGNDLVVSVDSDYILLKDAATVDVKIYSTDDDNLPDSLSVSGGVLSIGSTFDGDSIRASDYDVTTVDATSLSRGLKIYGTTNADYIAGGSGNDTVYGSNGADTIFGNAGNDCLNGGNGADVLYGGEGADKLNGGNGNDTLYGGAGNDTLTGSNGRDVFVYESGNDLITDYRAGYDKIKLASGTISRSSISGTSVVFTIGSSTLTVRGARGREITVIDASGRETTQKYSNAVYGSSAMLFSDDNFISSGASLDEITQKNYSVTNFSATSLESFAQVENLSLAAGGDK